jgi:putative ABC transport system substrate-binding protein
MLVGARDANSLSDALAGLEKNPPAGLVMATTAILFTLQPQVLAWAKRMQIPTISGAPLFAERGGTFSYGINFPEAYRYGAKYVARILKGAHPSDLPVEQYAKYELVLNLGAAREIGFTVPQSILQRADRVIE